MSQDARSGHSATAPQTAPHRNGSAAVDASAARVTSAGNAASNPLVFGPAWNYAPAPETVKVAIKDRYGLFINGRFVEPSLDKSTSVKKTDAYFTTINPANEQPLAQIAQASSADVDAAVRSARKAQPAWAALPAKERGKFLFRIARRIQERARELAVLETLDGGKPIRESRDLDVPLAAQHFFYYAGWADKLQYAFPGFAGGSALGGPALRAGSWAQGKSKSRLGEPAHQEPAHPAPVGVCGQIIPWNFPLLMAAWKLAPALACGNTCVLKPAETTSLTALRLAEILDEVGLPPGVVNIVTGDGRTGAALVEHPGVDKIAFTGSTEVGKRIAKAVAGTPKRLTLELGGKSANIIFEDASLDQAIEGIIQGIYFNQGHVCCAGSRLFVQESILSEVVKKLDVRLASLRIGDPMDKNTDIGAINSRAQLEKIEGYLKVGQDEGATLHVSGAFGTLGQVGYKLSAASNGTSNLAGAHATSTRVGDKGFFCRPCFFSNVQPSHTIAREEIFGPVLSVMSFRTPEEAIQRANNSPYGLAAGVWTDKGSKIFEIARKLEAGVVWLNTYNKFDAASPFGGFKESGFGREGGLQGLRGYVRV